MITQGSLNAKLRRRRAKATGKLRHPGTGRNEAVPRSGHLAAPLTREALGESRAVEWVKASPHRVTAMLLVPQPDS